jgi:hypothetical protein
MKKKWIQISLLLVLQFFYGCDYYDFRLVVINKLEHPISVQDFRNLYPHTEDFNSVDYYIQTEILPNARENLMKSGRNAWRESVGNNSNKNLNLFVFNTDTLRKYNSIGYLLENQLYTVYSFSLEELEDMKWEVKIEK